MKNISRMATNEYIGTKRRACAQVDRTKRKRILDKVCKTTDYGRKYANRLLTSSQRFHERKGRGMTYGNDVAEVLAGVRMPLPAVRGGQGETQMGKGEQAVRAWSTHRGQG